MVNRVLCATAVLISATNVLARTEEEDQVYWSQFGVGIQNEDVLDAVDKNGALVYEGVIAGVDVVISWDGFNLYVELDDFAAPDLEVGDDGLGRPAFYSSSGLRGFIDLDPEGNLVVQISGVSAEPVRVSVYSGDVLAAAKCNCFGTGSAGTIKACTDAMCTTGDSCQTGGTGGRNCRWSAATTGQLITLD